MRFSRTRLSDVLHIKHAPISNLLLSVVDTAHISHVALVVESVTCSFSSR
jgi:hypothetical protein